MRVAGKYVFFSTSIILLLLHLSVWIQDNHAFSVRSVRIEGAEQLAPDELLEAARIDTVESIWKADVQSIENRIRALPQVADVDVSRTFPSSIRIDVQEKMPVALLVDNGVWGLDSTGCLLPRLRPEVGMDFPVIVGLKLKQHRPGEIVDNREVVRLAKFLAELRETHPLVYDMISEATYRKTTGVRIVTVENHLPVMLGEDQLIQKSRKLEVVWQYLLRQGKLDAYRYLDLRFEDQILAKKG